MNERIKELEKQCWSHRVEGALVDGQLHFDTQKFAELIVRECMDICRSDDWEDQRGWGKMYAHKIQKHFGVGECG